MRWERSTGMFPSSPKALSLMQPPRPPPPGAPEAGVAVREAPTLGLWDWGFDYLVCLPLISSKGESKTLTEDARWDWVHVLGLCSETSVHQVREEKPRGALRVSVTTPALASGVLSEARPGLRAPPQPRTRGPGAGSGRQAGAAVLKEPCPRQGQGRDVATREQALRSPCAGPSAAGPRAPAATRWTQVHDPRLSAASSSRAGKQGGPEAGLSVIQAKWRMNFGDWRRKGFTSIHEAGLGAVRVVGKGRLN